MSLPMPPKSYFLTEAQLRAEVQRCEFCEEKPCQAACPCDCSPADFIKAVELGTPVDLQRAAALIMTQNPLGGLCGLVCPDWHCMAACARRGVDRPLDIPRVQATVIQRAKELGVMPRLEQAPRNGKRVAVVGGGPAGLAAALELDQHGYEVELFEAAETLGGMCRAIPASRLPREVLQSDLQWMLGQGSIKPHLGSRLREPARLLADGGFAAVIVATGLDAPIRLGIPGEELALVGLHYLEQPGQHDLRGRHVAVIGGGATAFDCAITAELQQAARVEMLALESLGEMPLSEAERRALQHSRIDVSGRVRVEQICVTAGQVSGLVTSKVRLRAGAGGFSLAAIEAIPGTTSRRDDLDLVIVAIGARAAVPRIAQPGLFYAGDCCEGPTTVVEAAAAGKQAAANVRAYLAREAAPQPEPRVRGHLKSSGRIPGYRFEPVPLTTSFFGRAIPSPFLLSAAPPSDGLAQMQRAYEAGWAGGVMKTAFDGVPIHIPSAYMFAFDRHTYANCDNVSGHSLERVCREVEELVRSYPDRLTLASTGGPVTGHDEADKRQWQSNTRKLESAGAMGIEYSLSCPQGGDGTEGDIVSQNAALTAKIIDWVMEAGDARVPKLFKLTGAVTSVAVIVAAIKEVLARYPHKPAGITLANTFPTLAFRAGNKKPWEEGIVVGMSGQGVLPISYLTLAKVAHLGVTISGNGGPMDYKAAADFLALGAETVQFCTIVMKHGYGVVRHLHGGLSHLLAARGLASVRELIGCALPTPITDFMALTPVKKISAADRDLCVKCGNCQRCPYLAVSPDEEQYPHTDPARCVGCSICALKCFAGAITMRERTATEAAALQEG